MFPAFPSPQAQHASRAERPAGRRRLALLAPHPAPDELAARLDEAAALLPADPESAALLLEGALHELIAGWYARQALPVPPPARLLADLAPRDALLALRLRLALAAPDVAARLAHLRALAHLLDPVHQPAVPISVRRLHP